MTVQEYQNQNFRIQQYRKLSTDLEKLEKFANVAKNTNDPIHLGVAKDHGWSSQYQLIDIFQEDFGVFLDSCIEKLNKLIDDL